MPTEPPRQPRQLVAMAYVLVAMASSATELTLASTGQAILPRLAATVFLLVWAFGIYAYLNARAARESRPSLLTMMVATLLLGALWGFDIVRVLTTTERLAPELVMVVLVRAAALTSVALAGNAVCLRISGGLSVALMLFASVLTEQRAIYGLMFSYALLGSYWLILLYWSQIQVKLLEGRSKRPPVLAITVCGLITGLLIVLVIGPRQTIGVLAECLGTSGGTSIASPDARGGVGDGQDLASGTKNVQSTGPVDSDIFLETQEHSLYDASNEKWGEPEKLKKREQSLAVAVANQPNVYREEKSRQPNPAREFSVMRKRRRDQSTPPTIAAHAAYFVKGKTPLHIRLVAFERFDGRRWIEPAIESEADGIGLGFGGWILLPSLEPSIVAGDLSHRIVVGKIDAPQIPLPAYAHSFRIDLVDRPDFFRFAQPGILAYRMKTGLPRQTVLETCSHTLKPEALRGLKFPAGRIYAHAKFLDPARPSGQLRDAPPNESGASFDPRVSGLASSWVKGTERGWRQIEAVVNHLRDEYTYDAGAPLSADCPDAMAHFLVEQRRGDDYAFATAACLLLRSLGYPCRFVEGLYAHPRRLDPTTQQTPIQMPGDLHTWVEVMLPGHDWIVVEPTPGFDVLGPEDGLFARLASLGSTLIGSVWNHPQRGIAFVLAVVASIRWWRSVAIGIVNCAWRLEFRGALRDQVLATVRLLERRASLAGRRRPPGATLRGWYRAAATPQTDLASQRALVGFLGIAEWALYGHSNEPLTPAQSDHEVERRCREFVRLWPANRLAPASPKAGRPTELRGRRGAFASLVPLLASFTFAAAATPVLSALTDSEHGSQQTPVATGRLRDLPKSVWADPVLSKTAENTQRFPVEANKPPKRTGPLRIPGVELVPDMSTAERINGVTMQGMTALFFFVVGASIGSFLNVVIYRLPRGMTLWGRKSHCPACEVELSFRENMPIVGWLRVRGRCHSCQAPISPRYPLVEVTAGLIFLVLLYMELLSGGKSLPIRHPNDYAGVVWIIWYPKWDLICLYLYHCFLLCTLLCVALIRIDRQPVPRSLFAVAAIVGFISPLAMPSLHPVPALFSAPAWLRWGAFPSGELITAAVGLAAGMGLGGLLVLAGKRGTPTGRWHAVPIAPGLAGLFLGWQAAVSISLLTALIQLVFVIIGRFSAPEADRLATSFAAIATFVQVVFWRPLSALAWWPSHSAGPGLLAVCAGLIALSVAATRLLRSRSPAAIAVPSSAFCAEESTSA